MDAHQDEIGLGSGSFFQIPLNLSLINAVDNGWRCIFQAVGAIGVIQEGDPYSLLFHHQGIVRLSLVGVSKGTGLNQGPIIQLFNGPFQPFLSPVQGVVVGIDQDIKSGPVQGIGQFVGTGKGRVAFVGGAGKGDLQVADDQVGFLQIGAEVLKTGFVVVSWLACGKC